MTKEFAAGVRPTGVGTFAGPAFLCLFFCTSLAASAAAPPPPDLLQKALKGPMAGVHDIIFAVRPTGPDPHWYANISYLSLIHISEPTRPY